LREFFVLRKRVAKPTPGGASAVVRAAIEQLESRQLLTVFVNGIDSENLGKGMWAWDLKNAMTNAGYSYPSQIQTFMNFEKNTQGMQYIIVKAADGNNLYNNATGQNYTTAVFNAAHTAGLKIFPYFYIYGGSSSHKAGSTTTVQGEIDIFNSTMSTIGGDGAVLDIEGEYATAVPTASAAIVQYATGIGKSQSGNGSGSRDNFFIAYSSFPYVSVHTNLPFVNLGDYFDAAMPQAYWNSWLTDPVTSHIRPSNVGATMTPTMMVDDVNSQYAQIAFDGLHNIFYGHPNSIKPVVITGMTYDSNSTTTAAELTEFTNAAINSTQVPTTGGSGFNTYQSFGYRGINYFDENSTNASERSALAALVVPVAPGTPGNPSPANNGTASSATPTLDWGDVVTTSTKAAATSYDVFIDGVLKANVTTSQYTVASVLSQGAHTWQIRANNIIGSALGANWSFTVSTLNGPSNLAVSSYGASSVSLSWADNSNNETQFLIERKTGAGGTYAQIGTSNANVAGFTDNGLSPATDYYYRVRATDGTSFSAYSNEFTIETLAATPTGLTASDGTYNDHVALTWNAAAGAALYLIYRNTANDPATASPYDISGTASYDDYFVAGGVTYYYWVASYNSANALSPKSVPDAGFFDATAPTVTTKSFQGEFGPPYVSFTFSEPMAPVNASNLTLENVDTASGPAPMVSSVQYISATNTAKFFISTDLPDGNFRATLTGVTDAAGNAPAGTDTCDFYFLRGDASGDRVVNALDFNALASHFGGANAGFSSGDFNFDGVVNTDDFSLLASHWLASTPAPLPPPGAPLGRLFADRLIKRDDATDATAASIHSLL
jgi:hypothetical protein